MERHLAAILATDVVGDPGFLGLQDPASHLLFWKQQGKIQAQTKSFSARIRAFRPVARATTQTDKLISQL
jgi:hypothetical protein